MNMTGTHTNHQLGPRGRLALLDAGGRTVTSVSGSVWLTMEGDTRDVVLEPGASFVIDHAGLTIIAAEQPSLVRVTAPNRPYTWWRRWWEVVVDYLEHTYGPGAIRPTRKQWYYNQRAKEQTCRSFT